MSGKSTGLAAGGHHAMARDNERDWIPGQSLPNVARIAGLAQRFGKLAVGASFSRRDFSSGFIHLPRKPVRSVQVQCDVSKILNFTMKVLAYFLDDLGNSRRRRARFARAG